MTTNGKSVLTTLGVGLLVGILLSTIFQNAFVGLLIGVGVALGGAYLTNNGQVGLGSAEFDPYEELIKQARGDRALAERLVKYEMKQDPSISRSLAADRALGRWERDRR